ncbi:MAG TPA: alpha/beta hydrolase [Edaphocola sp.]|nr:alpha/beta hydrolase [Edaphocola sp.]
MKLIKKLLLLFVVLFFGISAWAQTNSSYVFKDIPFKIIPNKDTVKLDLFLPTVRRYVTTPLVLHIHGGAWVEGDKDIEQYYYMRSLRDSLQQNGIAYMSINYRLLNSNIHLKDQLEDVYASLEWLKDNASKYNIDLNNVGVIGESAGAHLALMLTYSDVAKPAVPINYIVDLFGPTDINALLRTNAGWVVKTAFKWVKPKLYDLRNRLLLQMTNNDIEKNKNKVKEVAASFSPINYINGKVKTPILMQHGTKDPIVPYKQSIALKRKLDKFGIENYLIKVPKADHGFTTTSKVELNTLIKGALDFILSNSQMNQ